MLVGSLTFVLLLGIWDDLHPLPPGKKFIGQVVAASIVYFAGFRITAITHPFGPSLLELDLLAFPLTILWVVGITNAFNLIDNMDGLCAGVGAIAAAALAAYSLRFDLPEFGHCFTYVGAATHYRPDLDPFDWYKAMVLRGCAFNRFPEDYVNAFRAVSAVPDPDEGRRRAQWDVVARLI